MKRKILLDRRFEKSTNFTVWGNTSSTDFLPNTGTGQNGWYRSLSSMSDGTEKANNSFRIKGGLKAFEEPMAITGTLIVPVYDPQGTGIVAADPCLPV